VDSIALCYQIRTQPERQRPSPSRLCTSRYSIPWWSSLIADDALEAGVHLSTGWLPDRHLPDKALDLLDEACTRARFPTISAPADLSAGLVVTAHTVAKVLSGWAGVPAEGVLEGG